MHGYTVSSAREGQCLANFVKVCYYAGMLNKRQKQRAIAEAKRHDHDTGSPEVQVAILTRKINALASHLKKNAKDLHSRRGLLGMVATRRKHLKYLETSNKRRYNAIIKKLKLKK